MKLAKITISVDESLRKEIALSREKYGQFNISLICREALIKALKRVKEEYQYPITTA